MKKSERHKWEYVVCDNVSWVVNDDHILAFQGKGSDSPHTILGLETVLWDLVSRKVSEPRRSDILVALASNSKAKLEEWSGEILQKWVAFGLLREMEP